MKITINNFVSYDVDHKIQLDFPYCLVYNNFEFEVLYSNYITQGVIKMAHTEMTIKELKAENERLNAHIGKLRAEIIEAQEYVELPIVMRTHFTGDEPYVGWKGLGRALEEVLDERDAAKKALNKDQ